MEHPEEFPMLITHSKRREEQKKGLLVCPRSIPWAMLVPHEAQALRYHGQTLKRLAERGGLGPCEAVAVLKDRNWRMMEWNDAVTRLNELVKEWKEKNP